MVYQKNQCIRMLDAYSSVFEQYGGRDGEEVYAAIIAYDEAFDKLKSHFMSHQETVKREAERTKHGQEKLELLRRRNAILEAQCEARASLSAARKEQNTKFDKQTALLNNQVAALQNQCTNSEAETTALKEQVQDMEYLEDVFNYQIKICRDDCNDRYNTLNDRLVALEKQCAAHETETVALKAQNTIQQDGLASLDKKHNLLAVKHFLLSNGVSHLKKHVVASENAGSKNTAGKDEKIILLNRLALLEDSRTSFDKEITRLQTCINALRGTAAFHEAETAIVKTECSDVQDQYDELQERVTTLEDRTDLLKDEHVNHEASFLIRIGRKAIDRLQDQIAVANTITQRHVYPLQAEVLDIKKQCIELMNKIEALDQCRQQNPVEMEDATSPKADPDEFELV